MMKECAVCGDPMAVAKGIEHNSVRQKVEFALLHGFKLRQKDHRVAHRKCLVSLDRYIVAKGLRDEYCKFIGAPMWKRPT